MMICCITAPVKRRGGYVKSGQCIERTSGISEIGGKRRYRADRIGDVPGLVLRVTPSPFATDGELDRRVRAIEEVRDLFR